MNGAVSTYVYDGDGQRVSKTVGTVTTVYVYDAFGNEAAEYIGKNDPSACGTPTCFVVEDHLGSTRLLTDANGSSSVSRYDYQPFGQAIPEGYGGRTTAMGYQSAADDVSPKFTGQDRDAETVSDDWFQVRYMDAAQGRFQSVDPGNAGANLGDPQSWNGYSYVGTNPLSYTGSERNVRRGYRYWRCSVRPGMCRRWRCRRYRDCARGHLWVWRWWTASYDSAGVGYAVEPGYWVGKRRHDGGQ